MTAIALAQIFGLDLAKEGVLPMLHPCCFGHPVLFKHLQQAESEQVTGWDNNLCRFWTAAIDQDSPARFTWHSDGAAHGFNEQGHQQQRNAHKVLVAHVKETASPEKKNNAVALLELLPSTPTKVELKSGVTVIVGSENPGKKVMTLEQVQAVLDGMESLQQRSAHKVLVAHVKETASPEKKNNAAALWDLLPSAPIEVTLKSGATVIVGSENPGDKVMTLEQVQSALNGMEGLKQNGAHHDVARTYETAKSSYMIFHEDECVAIKAMSPQIEESAIFETVYDMWQKMSTEKKESYRTEVRNPCISQPRN